MSDKADSGLSLRDVADTLSRIQAALDKRNTEAEVQKEAFDRLHQELTQYKEDFVFQTTKPFLLDLLMFYDSLTWFHRSLVKPDVTPEVIAESFQYLVDEFLEVLYRQDIVPVESSRTFDARIHKAVKVVPAPDVSRNNGVDQVLKRGFCRGGRVLRPEEVVVYRHGLKDKED
ncbi:MAG: nucleotide exchange factor GrpE [Deltaproteobacteria bacterium]|nr:nucleotide exchange factor GrpE [Deltaproteobacteria bacterium]